MDNTRSPWERELTPALWCSSDETRRVAYALSDCGKKIIASISVSTLRSDPPPVFQTRSRRSSWPWGNRLDWLEYSTPSRHDPGDSEYREWLDAAARAGAQVDVAVAHGWLGSLGLEPMSVWMPRATPAQYSDYWLLVIHALSWNECIPTTTTIQWTVESANPLHVSCTSSIAGPISTASLESWSHIVDILRRHVDSQERPIPRRLTPLADPEMIASAYRNGRLVERELRWNAVREDGLVLDCALVEDPRYRPPAEPGEASAIQRSAADPLQPDGPVGEGTRELTADNIPAAVDIAAPESVQEPATPEPQGAVTPVPDHGDRPAFRLDEDHFCAYEGERRCQLRDTKAFQILRILYRSWDFPVSCDAIRDTVWGGCVSKNSVQQCIRELRTAFKAAGFAHVTIKTDPNTYTLTHRDISENSAGIQR